MVSEKPVVFVSCGQYTEAEKGLGKDICTLIRKLCPDVEPYFAENQSSVEGLSNHILMSLFRSSGFICIMHRRGELKTPASKTITRGSVWVEQEIAIAAFMNHALGRSIPIFFYKQAGVSVEGIRSVLLMNPLVEFTSESQVLEDLKTILPLTVFKPFVEYEVAPAITYRNVIANSDRHTYSFVADVRNVGSQPVTHFLMRVFFPRLFLNPNTTYVNEDSTRSTESHICFVVSQKGRAPERLYPGGVMTNPLTIDYFIDSNLFRNPEAMRSEIVVELFSGSMAPKRQSFPIKDFQNY